jgi:ABC-type Fe3+ transport system permease subunit
MRPLVSPQPIVRAPDKALQMREDRRLSATIMLTTANTKVVSVIIYDLNESGDLGAISVLGIALLLITFAVVLVANRCC